MQKAQAPERRSARVRRSGERKPRQARVGARDHRDLPAVFVAHDQTVEPTSEIAPSVGAVVSTVSSWKVRKAVESGGTEVNRSGWRRSCSTSAQLAPPPAKASAVWTSPFPGRAAAGGRSSTRCRPTADRRSPEGSARGPSAHGPTWATTLGLQHLGTRRHAAFDRRSAPRGLAVDPGSELLDLRGGPQDDKGRSGGVEPHQDLVEVRYRDGDAAGRRRAQCGVEEDG